MQKRASSFVSSLPPFIISRQMMGDLRRRHLALLFFLIGSCAVPAAGLSADGWALLALLSSFPPPCAALQTLARSWNASHDTPCGWTGVSCSINSLRVVSLSLPPGAIMGDCAGFLPAKLGSLNELETISLPSINLSGPIPVELANCTRLRRIDLSGNNLTDPIPAQLFTQLPNLAVLHLESNQLSGSIPPEIGQCKNLAVLTVHDNRLSGNIPAEIGQLSLLQVFRAGGNALLSGRLPPELGNCSSLTQLGLAASGISGSIAPEFGRLSNLNTLMLFQANLSGRIPPELGNCSQLVELHLFVNTLTGPLPGELGKLKNLERLYLWQNELSGPIPAELGMLSSLQVLDLSQNRFSGSIPPSFGKLVGVSKLYLSANGLSGNIPAELGNCSSVTDLQLDRNGLTGEIPGELGKLAKLVQLFLWNNSLEGMIPSSLSNCKALQFLDFSWNRLTGSLPVELFELQSLSKFLLMANDLSGEIPSAIARCRSLYRLRLSMNRFTGTIPSELGELLNLTFFDISSNQLFGMIPDSIANCQALQLFNAHDNRLSGNIPARLGHLSNLQSLDLSSNQLTGPLPPSLGGLFRLTKLIVNANSLSGSIPSELGGCKKLTTLDLSSNSFSGPIPSSLGHISTLSVSFNICCNILSGSIPKEFSRLFALTELDISHNKLSGSLDVLGRMGSLVTLNISYNLFSGPLPNTFLFTSMSTNNYAGNPGLCVPSCFASNIAAAEGSKGNASREKVTIGFLFGSVGVMFAIGSFLLCAMIRNSRTREHEPFDIVWPWELTPFQKFSFTVEDVLGSMVDGNIIGKGCSGVVYKAEMPGGEIIAVKKIMASSTALPQRNFFKTEVDTLRAIRHKNIIRLLGFCTNHQINLLLYDYMPNGSLGEFIHEKRRMLDWDTGYKIALGAAQGLAYLHHDCVPPILHRDIKANNILLGARLEPYLADFGLAKIVMNTLGANQTELAGSYGYIAPEYAYTLSITDKSDVYSYGVVLLEILTGKRPMDASLGEGRHLTDWVHEMRHCHHDVADILDPRLRGMPDPFIQEMLQALGIAMDCVHPLPEERPTMRHVVSLLVGIRHEIEEYTKLDVLASATCKPSARTKELIGSPEMMQDSVVPSFTHTSSMSFSHTPPYSFA